MSARACRSDSKRATTSLVSMPALMSLRATRRRTGSMLLGQLDLAHARPRRSSGEGGRGRWPGRLLQQLGDRFFDGLRLIHISPSRCRTPLPSPAGRDHTEGRAGQSHQAPAGAEPPEYRTSIVGLSRDGPQGIDAAFARIWVYPGFEYVVGALLDPALQLRRGHLAVLAHDQCRHAGNVGSGLGRPGAEVIIPVGVRGLPG